MEYPRALAICLRKSGLSQATVAYHLGHHLLSRYATDTIPVRGLLRYLDHANDRDGRVISEKIDWKEFVYNLSNFGLTSTTSNREFQQHQIQQITIPDHPLASQPRKRKRLSKYSSPTTSNLGSQRGLNDKSAFHSEGLEETPNCDEERCYSPHTPEPDNVTSVPPLSQANDLTLEKELPSETIISNVSENDGSSFSCNIENHVSVVKTVKSDRSSVSDSSLAPPPKKKKGVKSCFVPVHDMDKELYASILLANPKMSPLNTKLAEKHWNELITSVKRAAPCKAWKFDVMASFGPGRAESLRYLHVNEWATYLATLANYTYRGREIIPDRVILESVRRTVPIDPIKLLGCKVSRVDGSGSAICGCP